MIPLSAITARVRTRFEAESTVRWSNADIWAAVNEGLDELSEATRFVERVASIPVVEGRNFYDLRGYVPDDFVALRAVWSTTRSDWLRPSSEGLLHTRWEEDPGDPDAFFRRGWCWMGVHPHASGSSGYFRAHLTCLAPQLNHDQAVFADLPDDLIPALEDYGLYELQSQDGETELSLEHWKDLVNRQRTLNDFVEDRGRSSGFLGGRR